MFFFYCYFKGDGTSEINQIKRKRPREDENIAQWDNIDEENESGFDEEDEERIWEVQVVEEPTRKRVAEIEGSGSKAFESNQ